MEKGTKTNPTIITIFGGSGDLTWRKLIPALYNLFLDGWLNEKFSIICIGRTEMKDGEFEKKLKDGVDRFSRSGKTKKEQWDEFAKFIIYKSGDFTNKSLYTDVKKEVAAFEKTAGESCNKIYYMAVYPQFFETIAQQLSDAGLAEDREGARLVIEKPFGTDLETAKALNTSLLKIFDEEQLYRIDHYLGKETVQNILAFRFANAMFEPLWNRNYIDHVQITVSEKIGVEDRGGYYEHSGALRDMV